MQQHGASNAACLYRGPISPGWRLCLSSAIRKTYLLIRRAKAILHKTLATSSATTDHGSRFLAYKTHYYFAIVTGEWGGSAIQMQMQLNLAIYERKHLEYSPEISSRVAVHYADGIRLIGSSVCLCVTGHGTSLDPSQRTECAAATNNQRTPVFSDY